MHANAALSLTQNRQSPAESIASERALAVRLSNVSPMC